MRPILSLLFLLGCMSIYAQQFALDILEASPRHHEWVKVMNGNRTVHCFVAYPEISASATTVIVIHENRGLTDWVRCFADELAEAGYLAIAPDLLSGFSEEYENTSEFPSSDDARTAIYQLDAEQVTADLKAVQAYLAAIPSANGKVAIAGFCWGGSQTFRYATNDAGIQAAMVFYGSPPKESEELARITAPVYGFYGESDQRINATIDGTAEKMDELRKIYDPVIYESVGHAFMRRGNDPAAEEAFREAYNTAFERLTGILGGL